MQNNKTIIFKSKPSVLTFSSVVGKKESEGPFGKICDLGVKDANNMGAAMAPPDVKIRPYPLGYGVRDLDLFSVVISALAVLKMLEMQ